MKRAEKEKTVAFLSENLAKAKAVILAEYRGIKVSEMTELRKEIKKVNGDIRVVKNRLAKRALQGLKQAALAEHLKGPTAMAYSSEDPAELSKVLARFVGTIEVLKFKVGFLGERVLNASEVVALSKLPSREELYARMLGTIMAPVSNFVRVLNAVPQKMVRALKEIEKSKGG